MKQKHEKTSKIVGGLNRRDLLKSSALAFGTLGLSEEAAASLTEPIDEMTVTLEESVIVSGGSKQVTIPHSHGATPLVVLPIPRSEDGSTDYWVASKTDSNIVVEFGSDTPAGDDNLVFDLLCMGDTSGSDSDDSSGGSDSDTTSEIIIDDFESGNLDNYKDETWKFTVQSTVTASGSYALESTQPYPQIYSMSGLNAYPSMGSTFRCKQFDRESAKDARINFGVQGAESMYEVLIYRNRLELNLTVQDEDTSLASTTLDKQGNEWYEIEVTWDDGTLGGTEGDITVTLYDSNADQVAQITANDTTFTDGGIGFRAMSTGSVFDHYRLT